MISVNCLAQNYQFNLLTNYKSENGFYKQKIIYSNKNDNSYFLYIYKFKDKNIGEIIDLKNSKHHFFKVIESEGYEKEIHHQFKYENTSDVFYRDLPNTVFDFKVIAKDSLSKTVKLIKYKNKKKKIITSIAELKIKNIPYNLFSLFRFSCLHPYENFTNLSFGENGIVESYKLLDTKNPIFIYLDYYSENIDFEVKVKQ